MVNLKLEIMDEQFIHTAQKLVNDRILGILNDTNMIQNLISIAIQQYINKHPNVFKTLILEELKNIVVETDTKTSVYGRYLESRTKILSPGNIKEELKKVLKEEVGSVLLNSLNQQIDLKIELKDNDTNKK